MNFWHNFSKCAPKKVTYLYIIIIEDIQRYTCLTQPIPNNRINVFLWLIMLVILIYSNLSIIFYSWYFGGWKKIPKIIFVSRLIIYMYNINSKQTYTYIEPRQGYCNSLMRVCNVLDNWLQLRADVRSQLAKFFGKLVPL